MATNRIPKTYAPVVALAEDAADGAGVHGGAVGLKQNTESAIRGDLGALVLAEGAVANLRLARARTSKAKISADSNGRAFIGRFIDFMGPRFGKRWGPLWEQAGFSNGSISNPRTVNGRFVLLGKMKNFLESHPEFHVTDPLKPELDVTDVLAGTLYEAYSTSRSEHHEATSESALKMTARDEALAKMRSRLTGLREELVQLGVPGDSPVWYAFGFSRPDDPEIPEAPGEVRLTPGAAGSGILMVSWKRARRSEASRVKIRVDGEAEARVFGLFEDLSATIRGLPLGVMLTVTVMGHNEAGDGRESVGVTISLN